MGRYADTTLLTTSTRAPQRLAPFKLPPSCTVWEVQAPLSERKVLLTNDLCL
jgi:hypothetical protein